MRRYSPKTLFLIGALMLVATSVAIPAIADPMLKMPDGSVVKAAELPFFKNRPKVLGFLQKVVDRKFESAMALAAPPAFCPGYNFTSWGGDDPVTRAAAKCQTKLDSQLEDRDWPAALRPACKCKIVVRHMTVLEPEILQRGTRFASVKLLIKNRNAETQQRAGVLEYQQDELVKQDFSLFNAGKNRICTGQLTFKIGELGKFSGTCLGGSEILDGGVAISCPTGVFCKRHIVGNMKMSDGVLIGFTTGLTAEQVREKYPELPEKFEIEASASEEKQEEFD
ncbi:MAG: hypothetical protein ACI9JL_003686 [Paracoccaceae bacterium]|jgi:hypothetical protein